MTGFDMRCGDCGAVRSCSHDGPSHVEDHAADCGVHAAYDTTSSASRQHYIDTGSYMYVGEAEEYSVLASELLAPRDEHGEVEGEGW